MNWRLFLTTFSTIFFAEIGDKTQLAALSLSASHRSKWAVFAGSSLALVIASLIAVLAGDALGRVISPQWIRRIAGTLFVVVGVLLLTGRELVTSAP